MVPLTAGPRGGGVSSSAWLHISKMVGKSSKVHEENRGRWWTISSLVICTDRPGLIVPSSCFSQFILSFFGLSNSCYWVTIIPCVAQRRKCCRRFKVLSTGRREPSPMWQPGAEGEILQQGKRGLTFIKAGWKTHLRGSAVSLNTASSNCGSIFS